jgi:hypothetical protein
VPWTRALAVAAIIERLEFPRRALRTVASLLAHRVSLRQRASIAAVLPLAAVPPAAYRLAKRVLLRAPVVARADAAERYDDLRL